MEIALKKGFALGIALGIALVSHWYRTGDRTGYCLWRIPAGGDPFSPSHQPTHGGAAISTRFARSVPKHISTTSDGAHTSRSFTGQVIVVSLSTLTRPPHELQTKQIYAGHSPPLQPRRSALLQSCENGYFARESRYKSNKG